MRILILVDLLNNWALHNRAKAIAKFMPEHQVEIRPALGRAEKFLGDHDRFDVVHFNFTWGLDAFADFIIRNKQKCLLTVVNERSLLQGAGVEIDVLKKIFSEALYITAVNRKMAEATGGIYIPNGIDGDIFGECPGPVVGYAGTGMVNKNPQLIEQACKELGLELRIAGYKYHNRGRERTPDFAHESMQAFYRDLDVFVHASATEGFSNTVIEALSCNVPVIMTKQGAWQEFEGWVEFIEPSVEDIKRALKKFMGRSLVLEKFMWKDVVPQYDAVYKRIYANNNGFQTFE